MSLQAVEGLSYVEGAIRQMEGGGSVDMLACNIISHTQNALYLVERTREIDHAANRLIELAQIHGRRHQDSASSKTEQSAQAQSIAALQTAYLSLSTLLKSAESSQEAHYLGRG